MEKIKLAYKKMQLVYSVMELVCMLEVIYSVFTNKLDRATLFLVWAVVLKLDRWEVKKNGEKQTITI